MHSLYLDFLMFKSGLALLCTDDPCGSRSSDATSSSFPLHISKSLTGRANGFLLSLRCLLNILVVILIESFTILLSIPLCVNHALQ